MLFDKPKTHEFVKRGSASIFARLQPNPPRERADTIAEGYLRHEAKSLPGPRDVRIAGADVALTEPAQDLGLDFPSLWNLSLQQCKQLEQAGELTGPYVDSSICDICPFES